MMTEEANPDIGSGVSLANAASCDRKEGMTAFLEKRPRIFTGE